MRRREKDVRGERSKKSWAFSASFSFFKASISAACASTMLVALAMVAVARKPRRKTKRRAIGSRKGGGESGMREGRHGLQSLQPALECSAG